MAKPKKTSAPPSKVSKAKPAQAASSKQMSKQTSKQTAKQTAQAAKPAAETKISRSEAERILGSWPRLTDIQRAAFSAQHDDARCDELGARTQSGAVSKDAIAFAHTIDATLRKNVPALRRYTPARFAFFLECLVALDRARDEQAAGKDSAAPARRSLDQARARATDVRRELLHAIDMLVGDHEMERGELERASGSAKTDEALVSSLNDLARLADSWLRRTDGESRALVSSIDLQRGDVDLAWATASELESASDRASGKRVGATGHDTTSVNRAEGRVLLEMRQSIRAFSHAADQNKLVPRLTPGPGTRNVLAGHPSGKASDKNGAPATATT